MPLAKGAPKVVYTSPAPPPQPPNPLVPQPATAQVHVGVPVVQGELAPEIVTRITKQNLAQLRYCHERSLQVNPTVQRKLVVKFIVGGNGEVRVAQVQQSSLGNPELEQCAAGRVRTWTFSPPKGGGVAIVSLPILFSNP